MDLVPHLPAHAESTIRQFLSAHALPPSAEGVVVGLSGGIDSALCARLAADALGPERVLGVLLPAEGFPDSLLEETVGYAEALGIAHRTVSLVGIVGAFRAALPDVTDRITTGNTVARLRMAVLYALARDQRRLVLGTGNKSELLQGYFTKYGDGGVDLLPIGDLYKTQLRALASDLGLPKALRDRPPSAGFWEGQTDEEELGTSYADLDRVLFGIEQLCRPDEIHERTGIPLEAIHRISERVALTRHKRRLPPVAKIGWRTVGLDWRE
ncbi:MAG TPA: NAD+ synthase [Thermoplasmata archaeon]|nr:NAD+ synthase [Thermoplasmata archaeon]